MEIRIVPDQACPTCGAMYGHTDKKLDFPNRPKVTDKEGVSWWKCCNSECDVGYYEPKSGRVEAKITSEQAKELMEWVDANFENFEVPDLKDLFGGDA